MVASALVFVLLVAAPTLSLAERIEGARAVERARYRFVIGATRPFDEVHPRSVFEEKVRREIAAEGVLARQFGMRVTRATLSAEYERIERETRASDQWEAVKKALGGSRRTIEEVVCRPLLVDRVLRARFAFDRTIHAAEHREARLAREAFLAGETPSGATLLRLSHRTDAEEGTDEILERARAEGSQPRVLEPADVQPERDRPLVVHPEMVRVLERELKTSGDVTTILEERERFSVFRLVDSDADEWRVEALQVAKREFGRWLEDGLGAAVPPP